MNRQRHNKIDLAIFQAIRYAGQFAYPLTAREIWSWLPHLPLEDSLLRERIMSLVSSGFLEKHGNLITLPGQKRLIQIRRLRTRSSLHKWEIAKKTAGMLSFLPTIQLIVVTGSLAMNNSDSQDDIDFMIITRTNTLWLTRFLVVLILKALRLRRSPLAARTENIKDKICDNLYLDSSSISINHKSGSSLYLAHEILQTKPIFDRGGVYHSFLMSNAWVSRYLPNAYCHLVKKYTSQQTIQKLDYFFMLFAFVNFVLFVIQYLYMLPKMTHESVSLHSAFFHPSRLPAPSRFNHLNSQKTNPLTRMYSFL